MKHLRKLLFPFSAVYYCVVWVRNFCFDRKLCVSKSYSFPLICIGNLSTGGTGKTPMTEYMIRLLKDRTSLGVLSRGYGRKTKGYIEVDALHTATEVGDEPLQYASKFKGVRVAVCEDRKTGITQLRSDKPKPELILLDDAFQHRKVSAGFNIVLTSYKELFYKDYVLPVGNLRDIRKQAKRAEAIVVTKCPPTISEREKQEIRTKILRYSNSPVYFTTIDYDQTARHKQEDVAITALKDEDVTLVTGIANPVPLLNFLESKDVTYTHKKYRDHYNFTPSDIAYLKKCSCILTTEKDYMRLKSILTHDNLYYLPITVRFLGDDAVVFEKMIEDFMSR